MWEQDKCTKFNQKSATTKEKENTSCIGNSEFSTNQPQPISTMHISLWFAFGTLRFTLFKPEVLLAFFIMEQRRRRSDWWLKQPWRVAGSKRRGHNEPRPAHTYPRVHGLAAAGSCSAAAPAAMELRSLSKLHGRPRTKRKQSNGGGSEGEWKRSEGALVPLPFSSRALSVL